MQVQKSVKSVRWVQKQTKAEMIYYCRYYSVAERQKQWKLLWKNNQKAAAYVLIFPPVFNVLNETNFAIT